MGPSVSQIEDIINRGAEIRSRLRELLSRHEYPLDKNLDTKTTFLTGYVDIALEHHEAIELLIKTKLFGSAFALVRPLIETMLRALWINALATPSQIEGAGQDKDIFPAMSQMLTEIDQTYATGTLFQSFKGSNWKAMCSYAHSGARQVARRFTDGEVKPSYSDGAILEVLNVTNTAVILLTIAFFKSIGCQREADETERMILEYGVAKGAKRRRDSSLG